MSCRSGNGGARYLCTLCSHSKVCSLIFSCSNSLVRPGRGGGFSAGRRRRGSGPTRREVPQNPACRRGLSAARHANSGTTKILRGLSGFLAQTDAWRSTHSGPYITGPDQSQTAGHVRRAKVVHSLLTMTRVLPGRKKRGRVLPVVLPVFRPIMRFSR